MSSLAEDMGHFGFLGFPGELDLANLDGNDLAAIDSFFADSSAGQTDSPIGNSSAGHDIGKQHPRNDEEATVQAFVDISAGQRYENHHSAMGTKPIYALTMSDFLLEDIHQIQKDDDACASEFSTGLSDGESIIDDSSAVTSNVNLSQQELYGFLTKHERNGSLTSIFEKHPVILARALKSLDNCEVLFKFLTKHQCLVANWLAQHPNCQVLGGFLAKYPAATNMALKNEPALVENFLKEKPEALHIYLDSHPDVLHDYLKIRPKQLQKYKRTFPDGRSTSRRPTKSHGNQKKPSIGIIAKDANTSLSSPKHPQSPGFHNAVSSSPPSSTLIEQNDDNNQANDPNITAIANSKKSRSSSHKSDKRLGTETVSVSSDDQELKQEIQTKKFNKGRDTISIETKEVSEDDCLDEHFNQVRQRNTKAPGANLRRQRARRIIMSSEDDTNFSEAEDELDSDYEVDVKVKQNTKADMNAARALMSMSDEDSKLKKKSKKNNALKAPTPHNRSAGSRAATVATDASNHSPSKKNPKKKPGPQVAWTAQSEERAIKHMLDVRDEGLIQGEHRFEEVSNRLNAEFDAPRTGTSVKNWWNRYGRARSGFDERKRSNRAKAPLSTSLGGRAKRKAVEEEDEEDEEENEEEEEEDGEDEEEDARARARAFANGTRQKKKVKYTF